MTKVSMSQGRPAIPSEVAREIRKKCGFGCIFCGCPIFEIHHIEPWSETGEHCPSNLTLLCGSCHAKEQKGLISRDRVRAANASPINCTIRHTTPTELFFNGTRASFVLGSVNLRNNSDTDYYTALHIDGVTVLGFRFVEGRLLLNAKALNQYNQISLIVEDGFLQMSTDPWDIHWKGKTITIRDGIRKTRLQITFEPPNSVVVSNGFFLVNGIAIQIKDGVLECLNTKNRFKKCDLATNGAGMAFGGVSMVGWAYWEPNINRYKWLLPKWMPEQQWDHELLERYGAGGAVQDTETV